MKKIASFVFGLGWMFAVSAQTSTEPPKGDLAVGNPAGDPVAGKVKAIAICSGCHGIPGTKAAYPEVYSVPKIGGQNPAYLVSALKSYKSGERFNQTMRGLAAALSDKEMVDIAAYYGQK